MTATEEADQIDVDVDLIEIDVTKGCWGDPPAVRADSSLLGPLRSWSGSFPVRPAAPLGTRWAA
jgi:hypothetical protein